MLRNSSVDFAQRTGAVPPADSAPFETPELAIYLFGQMEVILSGRPVTSPLPRRATWLLAILAMRRGRPIERRSLAGLLWPENSDASALHNLRQILPGLRRALGPVGNLIRTVSPRSILLQPTNGVWVDAIVFDGLVADGSMLALERAVELYRGPSWIRGTNPWPWKRGNSEIGRLFRQWSDLRNATLLWGITRRRRKSCDALSPPTRTENPLQELL